VAADLTGDLRAVSTLAVKPETDRFTSKHRNLHSPLSRNFPRIADPIDPKSDDADFLRIAVFALKHSH